VLLAAYFAFTKWSRWGRALRACNEDREAAALLGIPTNRIIMWTFAAGSALAGLGGGLLAAILPVTVNEGGLVIVKAFSVALVGGLGSPNGVIAGALLLGILETFLPGVLIPVEWAPAVPFALIVFILLVRPQGLFRGTEGAPVS
jgi:branched-chain amino acid transport system permease protein